MDPQARIEVQVQPRASANELAGMRDGVLRVRVKAPPVDGKANTAVVELLAKELGVPKTQIKVSRGAASRRKIIQINGMTQEAASRWLQQLYT